ncbi:MAG: radical SAM protein [Dehalococcoidia bacterium]|jgi:uncharacterized protein
MKFNIKDYYLIKSDEVNSSIAFHIPTNTIFQLTDNLFKVFQNSISDKPIADISAEMKLTTEEILSFFNSINGVVAKKAMIHTRDKANILDRVTLHIANDCNLNCSYCYANGGNYNEPKKLMNENKAVEIIDFLISKFSYINGLVFFGGEPLLNVKVIERVCGYLSDLYNKGRIRYLPGFGIITNGTIINDKIVKLINDYEIAITVSIDGPKEINDLHRVFRNHRGTYTRIHNFIDIIQKNTNANIQFESTFTADHLKMGYSEDDIHFFMRKEFGIRGMVVPVQNHTVNDDLPTELNKNTSFRRRIFRIFNEPDNTEIVLDDNVLNSLSSLVTCVPRGLCPIGTKMIAISVDGKIYPCHIIVGNEHLCIGDTNGENIFTNPDKYYMVNPYLNLVNQAIAPCKNCWARNLCSGCSLKGLFDNNTCMFLPHPKSDFCKLQEGFISELILNVAKIKCNPENWEKFIARLNSTENKYV